MYGHMELPWLFSFCVIAKHIYYFFSSGNFLLLKLIMSFLHSTTKTGLFLVTEKKWTFFLLFWYWAYFSLFAFSGKRPVGAMERGRSRCWERWLVFGLGLLSSRTNLFDRCPNSSRTNRSVWGGPRPNVRPLSASLKNSIITHVHVPKYHVPSPSLTNWKHHPSFHVNREKLS